MATNVALDTLIAASTETGLLIIDAHVVAQMEDAAARAERAAHSRRQRRNPEAARHISFLLRQQAVERAYGRTNH